MVDDAKAYLEKLQSALKGFAAVDKETLQAFGNLNKTALKPGALDQKTKTLMCLAIGIATRGEPCISSRTAQAVQAGATRQELIETAAVGLMMGGSLALGPIVTLFVDTINMLAPESDN